jgi:selenide,water dikinase
LPRNVDPNLLVGFDTSDDAAVYRLNDEMALVLTADIITPPVDDGRVFGRIAAANSISDVYAMGGRPIVCLNLIGFPEGKLPDQTFHDIIAGALEVITEAGAVMAGGHTTEDDEPKFGLAVTGLVHPDDYWRNVGARPGDVLVLTKPIGSGVLFNANLKKLVSDEAMATCIDTLTRLNKDAAEAIRPFGPHAVTDVTGFGLAGHAFEMASGSQVTFEIAFDRIPTLPEALEMYRRGVGTGVNRNNRAMIQESTRFERDLDMPQQEILVDPQTSGGLLAAIDASKVDDALAALNAAGVESACIGSVHEYDGHHLAVI